MLSTLNLPSINTFRQFVAGEAAARAIFRKFLYELLNDAQDVEADVIVIQAQIAAAVLLHVGTITNPVADDASGVHASNDDDTQVWPGPFTDPAVPRNVSITFGAAWAGGAVTFVGLDQFDAPISEVIGSSPGNLVYGTKVFKEIIAISHAAAGPAGAGHGATAGWGHKFGIAKVLSAAIGILTADGSSEDATWDATYHAFIPTQLPNGAIDFTWAVPI